MIDPLTRLLAAIFLPEKFRNQPDPDRTITTVTTVDNQRISTITRPDGTQFQVIASLPGSRRPGNARIIYSESTPPFPPHGIIDS